jgi:hypothetical protein
MKTGISDNRYCESGGISAAFTNRNGIANGRITGSALFRLVYP